MAAASDLAAMGATPLGALSALAVADDVDDAALDAIAEGQAEAARAVGTAIIGGNLARGKETSVTTTLLGQALRPLLRSGARPGDGLFLAGAVGLAAAGLSALMQGRVDASTEACVRAWRRPRAKSAAGLALRDVASAAIDISDGLSRDAYHVAEASSVRLVIDETLLRRTVPDELEVAARALGADALQWMLTGGEDYALLATSAHPGIPGFERIGTVEAGEPAIVLAKADGTRVGIDPRGFDHFG
jgi:thiamine-monophosphate kinase